jgi:uncharacterized membrane protein (DUF2068 family)
MLAAFAGALGFFLIILAAIYAIAAFGLFTRKRWGWYMAIVAAALGLLQAVFSLLSGEIVSAIFGLAISGFMGWYLLAPHVQAWFGVAHNVPWQYKPMNF